MKKIMFTLAAVACAATMQAAQFNWTAKNIYDGWDGGSSKIDGTAYLFLVGGEVSESAISTAISSAADTSSLGTTLSGKSIDSQSVSGGLIEGLTGDVSASAPASLFFVVISGDNVYQSAAISVDEIATIGSTDALSVLRKLLLRLLLGGKPLVAARRPAPVLFLNRRAVSCSSLVARCSRCAGSRSKQYGFIET